MYKYYLFKIKSVYNDNDLYSLFESIRRSSVDFILTSFSFYNSITESITVDEKRDLIKYLSRQGNYQVNNKIYKYYDYFESEKVCVSIHNNYICIKTNKNNAKIFDYFKTFDNYYLCDFDNNTGAFISKRELVLE